MVTIVKHEWHQVDSQFAYELDEAMLTEIYPDLSEEEISKMLLDIEEGNIDVETVVNDAWDNDIYFDWERQHDDWWTDRKGGYEITYELGDADSWHTPPEAAPHDHKCTKCKWTGHRYDATYSWTDENGNELEDHRLICPYCDSPVVEFDPVATEDLPEANDQDLNLALAELKKEFDKLTDSETDDMTSEEKYVLKDIYPEGKYTIELRGRTLDAGVGSITEAQYEYWKDHEEFLSEALTDSFDYDDNETPEECKLYEYYNEYGDIKFIWGIESDAWLSITKDEETIFEGNLFEFIEKVHGSDDSYYDAMSSEEEFYYNFDLKDKGPVIAWQQGGKGTWFEGDFEGEFDPKKLRFDLIDFEGTDYIFKVHYNNEEVLNNGGDYWGKWSEYNVYNIK